MANKLPKVATELNSWSHNISRHDYNYAKHTHDPIAKYLTPHPLIYGLRSGGGLFGGGTVQTNFATGIWDLTA